MTQPPVQPVQPTNGTTDPADAPIGTLVSQLTEDLGKLTRQEFALARTELRDEAKKAGVGAGMLEGAALAGLLLALFASLAAMWGLAEVMHVGWAALIVAAVWAVVTAVLAVAGRNRLRKVEPVPDETIASVKEDAEWLRARKN